MQHEQTQFHALRSKHQAISADLTSQERQEAEGALHRIEVGMIGLFNLFIDLFRSS